VKDRVNALASALHFLTASHIAEDTFHAQRLKSRIWPAHQRPHALTPRDKLLDNILAEKTPGAGDKGVQC
jgi:hypothetical protein